MENEIFFEVSKHYGNALWKAVNFADVTKLKISVDPFSNKSFPKGNEGNFSVRGEEIKWAYMETSFFEEEKNFCDFAFPLGYVKIFWTWILFKVGTFYVHHYQVKLGNAELPKNWGPCLKEK